MPQISFSGNWGHSLYFETSYTQNVKSNTTTYYINNIQIGGGWEINFNAGQYVTFNINNEQKTVYIDRLDLDRNGWKKLGSLSWTIPHNQDGSVSVSLGIYCDLSSISYGNYSFGGIYNDWRDLYIPKILRGAELTSTLPTEISTSNATFNATCVIHNSSFKTIMELSYTNPKTNEWEWLGVTHEDKSSATFTIPRNHLDKLVGLFTNQSYANITFTLVSRDRNTNENISSIQKIIKLNFGGEYNPVINSFNLEERKQEIKALVLPQQNYVQDLSLIVPIFETTAKQGATIVDYGISYNDKSLNGSTGAFTLKIDTNGKIVVTLKVLDSRGKQATAIREITVLPYHAPRITAFDVQRDTRNQEKVNVSFQTAYANILGKNNYSILIQYSEKGKNTWNTAYSISNQYSVEKREDKYMLPITCKNISSYDFKMTITDKFTHSVYLDNVGMAIKPLVLIPQGGVFGGMPTNKKMRGLQVHGVLVDGNEIPYVKSETSPLIEVKSFANGVSHAQGYAKVMYQKDYFNRIFLYGVIKAPESAYTLFTLPVGYRPAQTKYFPVTDDAYNPAYIRILHTGEVQAASVKNKNFICLDGINFIEGN